MVAILKVYGIQESRSEGFRLQEINDEGIYQSPFAIWHDFELWDVRVKSHRLASFRFGIKFMFQRVFSMCMALSARAVPSSLVPLKHLLIAPS